jgi:hypothetical protein
MQYGNVRKQVAICFYVNKRLYWSLYRGLSDGFPQ